MNSEMKVLFAKEWKQAVRNRSALATATLLPVLFLLVIPVAQIFAASRGMLNTQMPGAVVPPGLANTSPEAMLAQFTLPLLLVMGGLVVPSVAASYTAVSEREKRTIDLLLALPVSLGQIMAAKVMAVLALALAIALPLAMVDFALLTWLGLADLPLLAGYLLELTAALGFSASSAVAVGLLAKDFRTANNLSGAFMGPMILLTLAFSLFLPWGIYRLVLHGVLMATLGIATLVVALKVVTLERFVL